MIRNTKEPIPLSVIQAAVEGDSEALAMVCDHYTPYIRYLAIRQTEDSCGRKHLRVDEDMCLQLKAKLLRSIVTNFRILAE